MNIDEVVPTSDSGEEDNLEQWCKEQAQKRARLLSVVPPINSISSSSSEPPRLGDPFHDKSPPRKRIKVCSAFLLVVQWRHILSSCLHIQKGLKHDMKNIKPYSSLPTMNKELWHWIPFPPQTRSVFELSEGNPPQFILSSHPNLDLKLL